MSRIERNTRAAEYMDQVEKLDKGINEMLSLRKELLDKAGELLKKDKPVVAISAVSRTQFAARETR